MTADAEVIVVGCGIVGAAITAALAADGRDVLALDPAPAVSGATAAGMGHLVVLDDSPPQFALSHHSRRLWSERLSRLPRSAEADVCGTLWVAADDEEMGLAEVKRRAYVAGGVAARLLGRDELLQREPQLAADLAGGLLIEDDSVIYPPAAARALLDDAERCGAVVRRAPVRRADEGAVETSTGQKMHASIIVVAAGLATADLVEDGGRLGLFAKKGHLAITDRLPGFLRSQVVELGYLKSAHGDAAVSVAFNAQPRRTGQVLLGSSRQVDATDSSVEMSILERLLARSLRYLPGLRSASIIRAWTGLRPCTRDHLPLIGPLKSEALLIACGHEGLGITTALATAELIADRIAGRRPRLDPTPYLPQRLYDGEAA